MRTMWLSGFAAVFLCASCAHSGTTAEEGAQGFATMAEQRSGLAAISPNPCPQVPDAPEVRAAAGALPAPAGKKWSQSYTGRYDHCGELTAAVVALEGDTDPLGPRQVLFFHKGAFVGTADSCAFGRASVKSARGDTVLVQYRWPRGQESATTMSGSANIKYRWSGDRVERIDQIPQELYESAHCAG